ncbi:MAG: 4-(cytidine 5'-diphospho)-2-C-methyl-D-erythritol kinase [Akkermansia sp.]|nr:4-(cytidine 5'-diphospho)-2-C-methyl-D-erythritol kinase [Akkermansia sp.]MBR2314932.1 4-(cytidine 5'-diphospho)-2-C-methyl-D-erythritol kinase [Akkermansia sp.]
MTTYQAPAKINLSLRVQTKVREDGFHNVDILMAPIDLYDQLDFHNSRTTTLLCDTPGVPTDESNLVFKAIREFEKAYGRKAKQRITLTKNIPHGAGLGGGSSDAAVTLLAVNEILGTNYELAELSAMAATLGSDVPYFLTPTICRCTGRGEIVTPVPELAGWSSPVVLLKPAFGVSTPSAYKNLTCSRRLKGVSYGPQKVDGITLINDLERPVFAKFPILAQMKHWLLEQPGTRAALMSGSGSTMFALTETPGQAREIATRALQELDPTLFTHCGIVNPQASAE